MAVKSAFDDDEENTTDVAKELRVIEDEPWQRLEWIDEDAGLSQPIVSRCY